MCDIFGLKCAHDGCESGLPLHISDFCLPRKVIKRVYCAEHPPKDYGEEYSDQTYKYLSFVDYEKEDFPKVGYLEIDWTTFGRVVAEYIQEERFRDLSNLLSHGAPIALNTANDYWIEWG